MRLPWSVRIGWLTTMVTAGLLWGAWSGPAGSRILRFVDGVDSSARPMSVTEAEVQLNDPWGSLVLRQGTFPADLGTTLAVLDQPAVGYSRQESFFVSESGHLPIGTMLNRTFRMVVTRSKPTDSAPSILISAPAGDRSSFVELMSWDPSKKAFNYYRRSEGTKWVWKGDTRHALQAATRGKGCFACHVHGVPVQKELRAPWSNWHSQSATIPPEAIPSREIREGPLFQNKSKAERLERIVRRWVSEGVQAQIASVMKKDTLADAAILLRPLFETGTVNFAASDDRGESTSATLTLPSRFFLDFDVLSQVLALATPSSFDGEIDRGHYRAALDRLDVRLEDGAGFVRRGDTHFAFFVPERAFEEVETIRQLIAQKVVNRHFVTSVLGIDFANPVYSADRARLLKYVPPTGNVEDGRSDLSERTALAIIQASPSTPDGSPERRFAAHWGMAPDALRAALEARVAQYVRAVEARLKTREGVEDCVRLAASRRHRFAPAPLNESPLLLPRTNVPAVPPLRMNPDATVGP